jgi:hypothetical protein
LFQKGFTRNIVLNIKILTPYFLIPSHYAALKIKPFASAPDFTWHILPIFVIKKVENHSRISKKRPKHMKFNRLNAKKYSFTFFLNNKTFIFAEVFALLPHQE